MANENLRAAKDAKNDEFYTQYHDIEVEMNAYLEYNSDVFRGKTILLPCDDPEWSNFTKYFAAKFDSLGLKKLISTSYAPESKNMLLGGLFSEFEQSSPQFDKNKSKTNGKIFVLDRDIDGDGRINIEDLQWQYLQGDGDFRSAEVTALRDEADIIITNPPFSLFREFLTWIISANKEFVIIGRNTAITYKDTFRLIKDDKIWLGATGSNRDMVFGVPEGTEVKLSDKKKAERMGYIGNYTRLGNSVWFTNIQHGKRHMVMPLMTMKDNLRYSKKKELRGRSDYPKYDNYNAIEVKYVATIPSDFDGIMGVSISFLDKYNPEQFEIIGMASSASYDSQIVGIPFLGEKDARPIVDGENKFARIFIKHKI